MASSCPTGKVRHPDRASAEIARQRVSVKARRNHAAARAYECGQCGGWHLTSMSRNQQRKGGWT